MKEHVTNSLMATRVTVLTVSLVVTVKLSLLAKPHLARTKEFVKTLKIRRGTLALAHQITPVIIVNLMYRVLRLTVQGRAKTVETVPTTFSLSFQNVHVKLGTLEVFVKLKNHVTMERLHVF